MSVVKDESGEWEDCRITYLHYGHPGLYPPLIRGIELLAGRGWQVDVMGIRLDPDRDAAFEVPSGVQVQLSDGVHTGRGRVLHYAWWTVLCLVKIRNRNVDWIYVSDPRSAPIGLLCRWMFSLKVLYHEHDAPRLESSCFRNRVIKQCRDRLASRADVCVAPNDGRLRLIPSPRNEHQERFEVKNAPLREEVYFNRANDRGPVEILYMGSIVPSRLPPSVIDAVAMLSQVILRVVGYETVGNPGYVADLKRRSTRLEVSSRVSFDGFLRRFESLSDMIKTANVGLSVLPQDTSDPNECTMAGASNKAFQYLACGVPLLVTDRPEWRKMFVNRGVARACRPKSAESVATELKWFVRNREKAREMGRQGRRLVEEEWNYETEFAPVIETLERRGRSAVEES